MFSSPATWDPRFPSNSGFLSRFYGIADNHARDLGLLRHSLSNGWSCRARGFGHGWQVISESIDRVFLLNPITQSEISLPSLAMLPSIEGWAMIDGVVIILKAVITSHPTLLENGDDCIVVAIVSLFECANQRFISEGPRNMRRDPLEKLVFCKVGDQKWTVIQDNQEREFIDLAYCNGFLYAWGQSSEALVFCKLGPSPKVTQISLKPEYFKASRYSQLIESCGDLLCVMWSFDRNNEVLGFIIARLEQNNKKWSNVNCLGEHSLFLGDECSISLLTSEHPGLKKNCIYFITSFMELRVGIFSLTDCSIEYLSFDTEVPTSVLQLWITPSLW